MAIPARFNFKGKLLKGPSEVNFPGDDFQR